MTENLALLMELLEKLPEMTVGERIAAIREERGLTRAELRKRAGIPSSTYVYVEKRDGLPNPKSLFNLSRALRVDPILIIKGKSWRLASRSLPDREKMSLLRLRKGWSQEEFALVLEKAGLDFQTTKLDSKRTRITQWEIGAASPPYEARRIIRMVLGDDTLFADSRKAEIALERLGKLHCPDKKQGNKGLLRLNKMVRIIRLVISDLKATKSIRDARLVELRLNHKLAEIVD